MTDQPKKYKSGKSRRETAVQGTNDSSIVSKCSMAAVGYFDDDFLKEFVSKTSRRSPLINRGYYIRATAVDFLLKKFLSSHPGRKQILSLGAGFDSAYFRLKSKALLDNVSFCEIDFSDVVKRKHAVIKNNVRLQELIPGYSDQVKKDDPLIEINTDGYKLLGVDLTQHNILEALLKFCGVDFDAPTLLLSECVLTYMTKRCSSKVIQWAAETFPNSTFVLYEQINPDDSFGLFMQNHFKTIGSALKCINAFPTMESQLQRFKDLGWENSEALDMNQFYNNLVSQEERVRVEFLEPFDEYEEWHLKCAHYMVLCGYNGDCQSLVSGLAKSGPSTLPNLIPDHIQIQPMPGVTNVMRIGHATTVYNDVMVTVAGFGEESGKHQRLSSVLLTDSKTMNSALVQLDMDLKQTEIGRLRHTICTLQDSSLIMIGGRMSPIFPCTQVLRLKISQVKGDNSATKGDNSLQAESNMDCDLEGTSEENQWCSNCKLLKAEESVYSKIDRQKLNCLISKSNDIPDVNCKLLNSDPKDVNFENKSNLPSKTEKCNKPSSNTEFSLTVNNFKVDKNHRVNNSEKEENTEVGEVSQRSVETVCTCDKRNRENMVSKSFSLDCAIIEQTGDVPVPRWRHSAVTCRKSGQEVIHVYGGRNDKQLAMDCSYFYNPQSGVWTKVHSQGSCPGRRQSHTANVWRDQILIAGGLDSNLRPLNSVHMLDVESSVWKELQVKGELLPRYAHTAEVIGDLLVLVGGVNLNHHPPGVTIISLLSGACAEYTLPASDTRFLVMLHQHQMCYHGDGRFVILGGGGNCFSFGTHLNRSPFVLDIARCIQNFMKSESNT